VTVDTSCPT